MLKIRSARAWKVSAVCAVLPQLSYVLKSSNDKEMAKAIREADGKALLFKYFRTQGLWKDLVAPFKCATVTPNVDVNKLVEDHPWLGREVHLRGCFCYDCCTPHKCKGEGLLVFLALRHQTVIRLVQIHVLLKLWRLFIVHFNNVCSQQIAHSYPLFPVSSEKLEKAHACTCGLTGQTLTCESQAHETIVGCLVSQVILQASMKN